LPVKKKAPENDELVVKPKETPITLNSSRNSGQIRSSDKLLFSSKQGLATSRK